MILVQMHGEPGSGKSTFARALGRALPAIVIDKDIVMSALLKAWIPREIAGPASYEVIRGMARPLLADGYSVVLDSPAFWPIIVEHAEGLAREMGARYFMIETRCHDVDEIERRLATRDRLASHPRERLDWLSTPGTREPLGRRLVLETTCPVEDLVAVAVGHLRCAVPA